MTAAHNRPFKFVRTVAPIIVIAALSACASSGRGHGHGASNSYGGDMAKLQAECDARGGILTPTNRLTGRPETDYACTVHGGASRIQP